MKKTTLQKMSSSEVSDPAAMEARSEQCALQAKRTHEARAKTYTELSPVEILRSVYGYPQFRGQQHAVIQQLMDGGDGIVLMPTGGGKSICYQIPALCRAGMGLVVSPLIALMQDQVDALAQLGVNARYVNSSLEEKQRMTIVDECLRGSVDLLYIAPERLLLDNTLSWLDRCELSLIAIDEAHCVSQWGHDFRQDYLRLDVLAEIFPDTPRVALTATANLQARAEIQEKLKLHNASWFISSFDRPNIHYTVSEKTDERKQILAFVRKHKKESGIIYALSRKRCETLAAFLSDKGVSAMPYHAGMSQEQRRSTQSTFLREEGIVIVATIAFGMGIDKPDVRYVLHANMPKSLEAYYQETGRAGRDGLPAEALLLYGFSDIVQLRQFIDASDGNLSHQHRERQKLDELLGWCELSQCRRGPLLEYFGETAKKEINPAEKAAQKIDQDCKNCDNCDAAPATVDRTVAAQQLLSSIYKSDQRFGLAHNIDILTGKTTEKIERFAHNELSTFGIGSSLTPANWRALGRALLSQNYLRVDNQAFGALKLNEKSRPLLKGELSFFMREFSDYKASEKNSRTLRSKNKGVSDDDRAVWEALTLRRKELADQFNIPSYMIFHDATLMEFMEKRPACREDLIEISGVGQAKLEKYGDAFLEVIDQFA